MSNTLFSTTANLKPIGMIIIGDFLKDLDDEHTLCFAKGLVNQGLIKLLCVVANLAPATLRAQGAKGTLDLLGLNDVPVAIGLPVFEGKAQPYEKDLPYLADVSALLPNGLELLVETLEGQDDQSVTLILQSGLTDAFQLVDKFPDLCKQKIERIVLMSGVETEGDEIKLSDDGFLVPNNANNNTFDMPSAVNLFQRIQELGIPMVITMRDAPYACNVPVKVYDMLEATGNPVGECLKRRQKGSIQHLWESACSPAGSEIRGTLPADRNREWFINVFCGGDNVTIEDGGDIWPFFKGFNLYDPVNLIAGVPSVLDMYFEPITVEVNGTEHKVIGLTKTRHGVKDVDALRQFLIDTELDGLKLEEPVAV